MTDDIIPPVDIVSTCLETEFGVFDFYCFNWGPHEEDNVLCQVRTPLVAPTLVRVQSACYTAEIFRSRDCDCHQQLEESLKLIGADGGILVYMLADGRGAGLIAKVRALEMWRSCKIDTADAYAELGIPADPRTYDRVAFVLQYFGVSSVRLLTNNPRKVQGLVDAGLTVFRERIEIPPTVYSRDYLRTKKHKMGHMLEDL